MSALGSIFSNVTVWIHGFQQVQRLSKAWVRPANGTLNCPPRQCKTCGCVSVAGCPLGQMGLSLARPSLFGDQFLGPLHGIPDLNSIAAYLKKTYPKDDLGKRERHGPKDPIVNRAGQGLELRSSLSNSSHRN